MPGLKTFFLGTSWGRRKQTAAECARDLLGVLHQMREIDESFGAWWHTAGSARRPKRIPIPLEQSALELLLEDGRTRTDYGNEIIESAGFLTTLGTAGTPTESSTLLIQCGGYGTSLAGTPLYNGFTLFLPTAGPTERRLLRPEPLVRLMECTVVAFQAIWALVDYLGGMRPDARGPFQVGWLTYVPSRPSELPELPPECTVHELSGGCIITLTQEKFDWDNERHLWLKEHVYNVLERAELLPPPGAAE